MALIAEFHIIALQRLTQQKSSDFFYIQKVKACSEQNLASAGDFLSMYERNALGVGIRGFNKKSNFVQLPLETTVAAGMEDKVPGSCICFSLKLHPMFHRQCRLCGRGW